MNASNPFSFRCLGTLSIAMGLYPPRAIFPLFLSAISCKMRVCKSFVCHSYENTGGVYQLFPFWFTQSSLCEGNALPAPERCDNPSGERFLEILR
jgi:hypothetical protein